jgi:hypothetical protein
MRQKLRNGYFSFNWNSWVRWANTELTMSRVVRARKPTSIDLSECMQAWEVLWDAIVSYAPSATGLSG